MTYKMEDCEIEGNGEVTNVAFGTTADYAYSQYLAKKKMIADLEYECELLIDKYHSEMRRASIPIWLREDLIQDIFGTDEKKQEFARKFLLDKFFTPEFRKRHLIEFSRVEWHGYGRIAAAIVLAIGDYEYTIEVPLPQNIRDEKDKELLMGQVKFRVDRIHKSKLKEFVREMEPVQMPTYDWKECFKAIEVIVEKEIHKEV